MRLTAKDAKAAGLPVPKRAKYGNRKTVVDGVTFDSKREASRWGELKLLEQAGKISGLYRQPKFDLVVNGKKVCGYVADFSYVESGKLIVEDVKSPVTRKNRAYRIKLKLLRQTHGIEIKET